MLNILLADCKEKTIAFHAILSTGLTNTPPDTIIKFGQVLVNEGSGYNPTTGKFTAPLDGVYSFSWTYCTNKGSVAYLGGYVDGKLIARISNHLGKHIRSSRHQTEETESILGSGVRTYCSTYTWSVHISIRIQTIWLLKFRTINHYQSN